MSRTSCYLWKGNSGSLRLFRSLSSVSSASKTSANLGALKIQRQQTLLPLRGCHTRDSPIMLQTPYKRMSNVNYRSQKGSLRMTSSHVPIRFAAKNRCVLLPHILAIDIGNNVERGSSVVWYSSTPPDRQKSPENPSKQEEVLPKGLERENITNVPNLLTVTRLIAAPVIGYLILHDQNAWAVGLLAYASITDLVDGYIARHWNLQTVIGTVLDPLADKLLMTILTVCLATTGALPFWIAGLILGRDVGLGIAAIYYRWISLPPPKTFWRYWDFSLPSAEVKPTTISKYNTALQLLLLLATTAQPLVPMDVSSLMTGLRYTVGTTTVWSGLSYIYTKDAVRILPQHAQNQTKGNEHLNGKAK